MKHESDAGFRVKEIFVLGTDCRPEFKIIENPWEGGIYRILSMHEPYNFKDFTGRELHDLIFGKKDD